ncbi:hypothetical protein CspeluHIS016_0407740 [Cutaneotrichosporon spelunceum]|uniref:Uncharacterized protein n=1 Tax=Cutaneotrichosporon spelunceum TaxID=1672016 RepID=A0AAD3TWT5_9TREE|nr:hypothetical protein CspeluHIS016_0407740 [Cutaneotrichosporon spelunceum]
MRALALLQFPAPTGPSQFSAPPCQFPVPNGPSRDDLFHVEERLREVNLQLVDAVKCLNKAGDHLMERRRDKLLEEAAALGRDWQQVRAQLDFHGVAVPLAPSVSDPDGKLWWSPQWTDNGFTHLEELVVVDLKEHLGRRSLVKAGSKASFSNVELANGEATPAPGPSSRAMQTTVSVPRRVPVQQPAKRKASEAELEEPVGSRRAPHGSSKYASHGSHPTSVSSVGHNAACRAIDGLWHPEFAWLITGQDQANGVSGPPMSDAEPQYSLEDIGKLLETLGEVGDGVDRTGSGARIENADSRT